MSQQGPTIRAALTAAALAYLSAAPVAFGQRKPATLTGTWRFDPEKTRAEAKAQLPDPQAGRGMVRVNGTESGRSPGGVGGQVNLVEAGGRAELGPLGMYARPLPELVIAQSDSTITLSDPSGRLRTYPLDGRKQVEPLLGADSLEIQARWKGGRLTTDRKLGQFGSIREVYSVNNDDDLIVEVRLSSPQLAQPVEMRRIYSRSKGSN